MNKSQIALIAALAMPTPAIAAPPPRPPETCTTAVDGTTLLCSQPIGNPCAGISAEDIWQYNQDHPWKIGGATIPVLDITKPFPMALDPRFGGSNACNVFMLMGRGGPYTFTQRFSVGRNNGILVIEPLN